MIPAVSGFLNLGVLQVARNGHESAIRVVASFEDLRRAMNENGIIGLVDAKLDIRTQGFLGLAGNKCYIFSALGVKPNKQTK